MSSLAIPICWKSDGGSQRCKVCKTEKRNEWRANRRALRLAA